MVLLGFVLVFFLLLVHPVEHPSKHLIGDGQGLEEHQFDLLRHVLEAAHDLARVDEDQNEVIQHDQDHHTYDAVENPHGHDDVDAGRSFGHGPDCTKNVDYNTMTTPWSVVRQRIWHMPRTLLALAVHAYRATLSPDHGPLQYLFSPGVCRHSPTCSTFALQALAERGAVLGSLLTLRRLLTCHPWRRADPKRLTELLTRDLP